MEAWKGTLLLQCRLCIYMYVVCALSDVGSNGKCKKLLFSEIFLGPYLFRQKLHTSDTSVACTLCILAYELALSLFLN